MNNENGDMPHSLVGHEEEVEVVVFKGQTESTSSQTSVNSTTNRRKVQIVIQRQTLNQQDVEERFSTGEIYKPKLVNKVAQRMKNSCMCSMLCLVSFFQQRLPILQWLPNYPLRKYFLSDLISAVTVLILHIPQGMAYGLLADVDPVNGLYTSFFPVIIYCMMGTSRHVSVGTMAVISLMAGNAVESLVAANKQNMPSLAIGETAGNLSFNGSENLFHSTDQFWPPTNLEIVVSLCLVTGLFQSTINIFSIIKNSNPATVLISFISMFILAVVKEQVNARFKNKLKMPIPIDLIVVALATVISYLGEFNRKYEVSIIGDIPTGFPEPVLPRMDLVPSLLPAGLGVGVVSYTIALSLAQMFAKKHKYVVDANQEFLAMGSANLFSSFFACFPCATALSRSMIQEKSGGKTQIVGLVSCLLMVIVLLVLGPFFYHLPKCILSSVILVALKGMFLEVLVLRKIWKISKIDSLIWLVSFSSVVILDIDYGLIMGVAFTILTVVYRTFAPHQTVLVNLPNTEIYVDKEYYSAQEIPGIKIFHFGGALYFVNKSLFVERLNNVITDKGVIKNIRTYKTLEEERNKEEYLKSVHHVIIDCSSFSYIDVSGVDTLLEVTKELKERNIIVLLASCSVPVYEVLRNATFLTKVPQPSIFPTIHDAVMYAQQNPRVN
ncbi:solute carrier family 26 member 10-like isoform X2 [Limulus polyphemus]|uniref:Solute carrier family 26 member 10-like isoform X2 n=1 Tax=Limulus polyphemus TaxID=6850 RepID=A0ABM1SZL0_LIMPO|nr:solute carrier family 26 member 10-like isoform X2 [Limulus polyphemus]